MRKRDKEMDSKNLPTSRRGKNCDVEALTLRSDEGAG